MRLEALGQVWGSWGGSQGPRGMIWKPWVRLGLWGKSGGSYR